MPDITIMDSILPQLKATHKASIQLRKLNDSDRKAILIRLADVVLEHKDFILESNRKDLEQMDDENPKKDRLLLTAQRIQGLAESLNEVAALPDPANIVLKSHHLDNGLDIQKISVPMGVVGVIYESRPNVTLDVASLCIRSGNACVLRGGSDAHNSNTSLVRLIHQVLDEFSISRECVKLLPTERKFVKELLEAERYVDIIIPRGSQELINFVRKNSLIPTIETGAGVCHTYVESSAQLAKAAEIVVNAKVSRPSVCNSLDTVIVDENIAQQFLPMIINGLKEYQVEIFADKKAYQILSDAGYSHLRAAEPEDFGREFLDYKCSVKVVKDIDEALPHIQTYSSRHSEAIVSENPQNIDRFLMEVDAAAVYANASTRFTDGGVFGLGAEIGISTQKLHARGPFALEKLVTEKWIIKGSGQIRN